MNYLTDPLYSFKAFQQGQPEAYRHYFHLHHYRIYCYLLGQVRDKKLARILTKNVFVLLIKIHATVRDADHLLRCLYLFARIAYLLHLREKWSAADLEAEFAFYSMDDPNIMEDPDVARNETLIALQEVLQKLSDRKSVV